MATLNDVPQLVDKKGCSYAAIALKLEPGKFNKWKKVMLCYLAGMEPYYLKCIKDGPFQPKTAKGDANPESQWTPDERRVVAHDQRLKIIILSCLLDDIMKSVISCVSAKETRTNLVHSFEGNEECNHTQTLNLADIYGRFIHKDNLIQRRYSETKKALITTPSSTLISTAFFSNNVIQDFQENYDDEVDERSSKEYLRDLDIEYHERALLANLKRFIKRRNHFSGQKANENTECYKRGNKGHFARDCFSNTSEPSYKSPVNNYSSESKGFQPKFTPKLIQSSSNSNNQADSKFQKDYKAEYKKMKSKLALLEASPSKVSDEEEVTQVKVLMAIADNELTVRKNHSRNGEWIDITMRKVNTLLSMDKDADWKNYLRTTQREEKINEKWLTSSKKVSQCISKQIPHQKKKVLRGELLTESLSKININENAFIPASMGYDQEMVPKTKDWVERLNPDSKLLNFNTGRILVPESQAVNVSLETLNTPKSSKDSKAEFLTPLPPLKNL
ncbi:hypothetical protein Tco_0804810 [Tanacetum coccineum]|uniref:CCHC-type domain-containing protein n=1 Tax=Tanacetum coccineum TaxID=301880 RepID=A0ABQ5A9L1_9ASTR